MTITLELPPDIQPDDARLLLAIKLYETGRLSLGKSAEFAGYTKRTFMEILAKHGVPIFNYTGDDLDAEDANP